MNQQLQTLFRNLKMKVFAMALRTVLVKKTSGEEKFFFENSFQVNLGYDEKGLSYVVFHQSGECLGTVYLKDLMEVSICLKKVYLHGYKCGEKQVCSLSSQAEAQWLYELLNDTLEAYKAPPMKDLDVDIDSLSAFLFRSEAAFFNIHSAFEGSVKMKKIRGTVEAWESGELGMNPATAVAATPEKQQEFDAALGLQPISIRLQKEVVESLKSIAETKGIGYQPLIRQVLMDYAKDPANSNFGK